MHGGEEKGVARRRVTSPVGFQAGSTIWLSVNLRTTEKYCESRSEGTQRKACRCPDVALNLSRENTPSRITLKFKT